MQDPEHVHCRCRKGDPLAPQVGFRHVEGGYPDPGRQFVHDDHQGWCWGGHDEEEGHEPYHIKKN